MTPAVPAVLAQLAAQLIANAAPEVPAGERASQLGLTAALMGILAEVWDRQAHILIEENTVLRSLLALPGADADFHLSALQAENNRLRGALIVAHEAAEAAADTAREAAIWAELARSTERRRIQSAPV